MLDHTHDIYTPQQIVLHTEISRYMTVIGFTVVLWDHVCTFDDEIQFMWNAPKSLVKILFLVNRYLTLLCLAFLAWETSRLGHLSNAFCIGLVTVLGCFQTMSLATWDLLLLFRVHALWGGRRSIVIATSFLYCVTYVCHAVVGLIGSAQLIPHLYFDPYAKTCVTDFRPRLLSFLWCFALFCETVMFILTLIRVIEDHKPDQINNALMRSLYYGQIIYNVVIIAVRIFNLVIFITLPPSFLFLGAYLIWALITALVTRMMLHLRRVASMESHRSTTTFFGETAFSTRIVWARHPSAMDLSSTAFSPGDHLAVERQNVDWSTEHGETGETIELQSYRADGSSTDDSGR